MFQKLYHRLGHYGLLVGLCSLLYLVNLGGPALWDLDEGRNATAALEMRESGNWIVPKFNGELRAHKPALLYWLQTAAYAVFGVSEFSARLPSALAAMLSVLIVYELGRRMFTPQTGLLAGVVLSSAVLFCAAGHFANPDALLCAFTSLTLFFTWKCLQSGRWPWFALAGTAAGLAVLAKGPVGIVIPIAVVGFYVLWSRRWNLAIRPLWSLAAFNCALVALPWYILVSLDTRQAFLTEFFLRHHLDRALAPMEGHSGPPWFYAAVMIVGLTPWSVFLGSSLWLAIKQVRCRVSGIGCPESIMEPKSEAYRFLLCWIGVYLLAFSVAATKLPNYILPAFPPLALLIADFLERWRTGELILPRWVQLTSMAMLALVGVLTTIGLLAASGEINVGLTLGTTWPGLERWALLGIVPVVGAALGVLSLLHERRTTFIAVVSLTSVAFVFAIAGVVCTTFDAFRAPRPLVAQAEAFVRHKDIRIACYQLEHLPSLNFYVQRNVSHYQDELQVSDFLRQDLHVFLFLPRAQWERLSPTLKVCCHFVASHADMYGGDDVVVVSNR